MIIEGRDVRERVTREIIGVEQIASDRVAWVGRVLIAKCHRSGEGARKRLHAVWRLRLEAKIIVNVRSYAIDVGPKAVTKALDLSIFRLGNLA